MRNFRIFGFLKRATPVMLTGVLFLSCSQDDGDIGDVINFDRAAMLENWYSNIIIPAVNNFEEDAESLKLSFSTFEQNPDNSNLETLKTDFRSAYISFQKIKPFEIGPAANLSLRASLNTYPTDTAQILSNIDLGNYNLATAANIDAKGFPALDYLLYGLNSSVWTDNNTSKYINYLKDIVDDIVLLAEQNSTGWNEYQSDFMNATGTDVGSSLGQLVNTINFDYELIKNAKIGFPAGKKTLGKTFPEASEAFYAGDLSMELASANCKAIRDFYQGVHFDESEDGLSLDDYLNELGTTSLGEPLYDLILARLNDAINKIELIPAPFSDAVDNNKTFVDEAYTAVQQNVILLKTELPSALGVLITYQDNDGD